MKRNIFLAAAAVIIILIILSSCARGPQKKPESFSSEPTISLYDNKTGEKKNIKIESYIEGVVAAEMEPGWPVSALAAQAIMARTFTMENIKNGLVKKLHGTDASTSVEEFQAYNANRINDNVRRAVSMTRGEVVLYRGQYIKGWFSACDGGTEASAKEGLAYIKTPTPYIKAGVKDNCLSVTAPENRFWRTDLPLYQVGEAVKSIGSDPGTINSVKITLRGPSGRAERIKIGNVEVGGPALRLALGSERVRSMLLDQAAVQGDKLVLAGKGFGHGVGMCQWGAYLMAGQGKSPEEIVNFYFKNIKITKLWK